MGHCEVAVPVVASSAMTRSKAGTRQPAHTALADIVSRFPVNNAWPELARAQAALDLI